MAQTRLEQLVPAHWVHSSHFTLPEDVRGTDVFRLLERLDQLLGKMGP